MSTTTCLNSDYLKGYLFCLNYQNLDVTEAHLRLLQFTKTEVFDSEKVSNLYQSISNGTYNLRSHQDLIIAENGKASENSVYELIELYRKEFSPPEDVYELLEKLKLAKFIRKDDINDWYDKQKHFQVEQLVRDYNTNAIRGFLVCLYLQNFSPVAAFDQLTVDAPQQEKLKLKDVIDLFQQIDQGEYVERARRPELWLDNLPELANAKIVKNLDLQSRSALKQTCGIFNKLIEKEKFHLDSLTIKHTPNILKIFTGPDVFSKKFLRDRFGYFVEQNGNMVLKKKPCENWFLEHMQNNLRCIAAVPNLTIRNLYFVQKDGNNNVNDPEIIFENIRKLKVENLYIEYYHVFKTAALVSILEICDVTTIRKIFVVTAFLPCYVIIEKLANFHFVTVSMKQSSVDYKLIAQLIEIFLQRPTFRELKLKSSLSFFNQIKIRVEFNIKDLTTPTVLHFPTDGDTKLTLIIHEDFIWFKGLCFIPGESDKTQEIPEYPKTNYKMDTLENRDKAEYFVKKLSRGYASLSYEKYLGYKDVKNISEKLLVIDDFHSMEIKLKIPIDEWDLELLHNDGIAYRYNEEPNELKVFGHECPSHSLNRILVVTIRKNMVKFIKDLEICFPIAERPVRYHVWVYKLRGSQADEYRIKLDS